MAVASSGVGFRWLGLLEKEFDKSYVGMEHASRTLAEDYDLDEMYDTHRKLLSNIGHCFVQLVHKAQSIFQTNAKLEAELVNLREDLSSATVTIAKSESEKKYLVCCLQSSLVENHKLKNSDGGGQSEDSLCESIQMRLAEQMASIQRLDWDQRKHEKRCHILEQDNTRLRQERGELVSELVGARLDAKYLDKELAGRIQQIQILLASNASQEHKQQVWAQIEAEMHLQRAKTIANMCYSKQKLRHSGANSDRDDKDDAEDDNLGNNHVVQNGRARLKQVHLHKHDSDELGMAILGGKEHGLPIMISEIFPDSAVGRCKKMCAGDVILAVNGDSFIEMGHNEAVQYLSALRGSILFDLENTIEADIDEVCDMEARFYNMYSQEDNITSDKSPPQRMTLLTHPGRAKDVRKASSLQQKKLSSQEKELPRVHNSPAKNKTNA